MPALRSSMSRDVADSRAIDMLDANMDSKLCAPDRLAGFRVVDLTEGICGPFASMQLADAGAEVIKIEPPAGAYARRSGPPFLNGERAGFLGLYRNEKRLMVD